MNVEIGTEAAQLPEKEYINGIFVAVFPVCRVWRTQSWQEWTQWWGSTPPSSLSSSTCSWAPCPTSPWAHSLSSASWSQRKARFALILWGQEHKIVQQRNTFAHGLNNYIDEKALWNNWKHSWENYQHKFLRLWASSLSAKVFIYGRFNSAQWGMWYLCW